MARHFTIVYYAFFLREEGEKPAEEAARAAGELAGRFITSWRLDASLPGSQDLLEAGEEVNCHLEAEAEGQQPPGSRFQLYLCTWHDAIVLVALAYHEQRQWAELAQAFSAVGVSLEQAARGSIGTTVLYHVELEDLEQAEEWLAEPTRGPLTWFGRREFRHRCRTRAGLLALERGRRATVAGREAVSPPGPRQGKRSSCRDGAVSCS